ncbi:hypothetical protein GFC29_1113 [Anoxybacillus sp. B7M1]|jgi:hypothetical protein|uniref:hypothetical protein n=1 Tax=unclassified Anoxybacillus TaxID=2639704 RepID=UPI0007B5B581|nr:MULTISPECIES: hypothetical protein [unclassified Anoxybacillus]ANB57389.1 hypothetical protein GFC28_511 [Anoxybacillus sp. B2M1]ANB64184.1 hypothetical protein GFC29_1113 [Anoxybacillus sp. B7M1]
MEKKSINIPSEKELTIKAIPVCDKHWDCCEQQGCPGLYYYIPSTGDLVFQGRCCY